MRGPVDEGIRNGLGEPAPAGYPIADARVELYDGSYHDVDSTEAAFRMAACLATRDAVQGAEPVLLEPLMRVEVVVPTEALPAVVANLLARRGRILGQQDRGDMHAVQSLVPLAELFGYSVDFRERTRGRGTCSIEFESFRPRQPADDDDRSSSVLEPRTSPPSPRDSAIALPEPDDGDHS